MRGQVAIVGVGSTGYGTDVATSHLGLGLRAAVAAIEDAGVDRSEIDGICGSGRDTFGVGGAPYLALQGGLGIERTTWVLNGWLSSCLVYAAQAVATGLCTTALVVQTHRREGRDDPFRRRAAELAAPSIWRNSDLGQRWHHNGEVYAAWMARYMHDYGAEQDVFGRIAVNNRSHAVRNPDAVLRTPLTLDEYLAAPETWAPMRTLDMNVPVDAGEALVLTTAERAQDLPGKAVHLDAASLGGTAVGEYYENAIGWTETAPWAGMAGLWARTDLGVDDIDLFYPHDGFSVCSVAFTEAAGFCGPGEAGELFESSWDSRRDILRLRGRTYVTTNGGGLSQGRTGGFASYGEAVRQLRGDCGDRQVPDARTALIGAGSFHHDPACVLLTAGRPLGPREDGGPR